MEYKITPQSGPCVLRGKTYGEALPHNGLLTPWRAPRQNPIAPNKYNIISGAGCKAPKAADIERASRKTARYFAGLIETVKENNLEPYTYLLHIFCAAPSLDRTSADWILPLLPENAPDECKVNI